MALVRHVDGELFGCRADLAVVAGQHELLFCIQGEHIHTVAQGQHKQGLWAIQGIATGHLLVAGL